MNEERFSESDLAPSNEERRAALADRLDRTAATVAVLAVGIAVGGMVALGACAAPFVFTLTPPPSNGNAMGAAFARFDHIAIACAALLLGAEVARTYLARRASRTITGRARRVLAILFAACTAYAGLALTPAINGLHRAGVVRGEGEDGVRLDVIHKRAELLGKAELAIGAVLIALHVFTVRRGDVEEEHFSAPLPPGPAA
jgi:hypothetical protein